jgi:hypothetical protein
MGDRLDLDAEDRIASYSIIGTNGQKMNLSASQRDTQDKPNHE